MITISPVTLRRVLWVDALSGVLMALSHGLAMAAVSALTGLPPTVLGVAVLIVVGAAALSTWLATRPSPPREGVRVLALGNLAWVAASAGLVLAGPWPLTAAGQAWVLLQALAVLLMATLEWAGARRPVAALRVAA
jgi:Na+/melibiose symporter-like transporter